MVGPETNDVKLGKEGISLQAWPIPTSTSRDGLTRMLAKHAGTQGSLTPRITKFGMRLATPPISGWSRLTMPARVGASYTYRHGTPGFFDPEDYDFETGQAVAGASPCRPHTATHIRTNKHSMHADVFARAQQCIERSIVVRECIMA